MIILMVAVALVGVVALCQACFLIWRQPPVEVEVEVDRDAHGPGRRLWSVQLSCALGAVVLVLLLVLPGNVLPFPVAPFAGTGLVMLQYLAPGAAAVLALVGVPRVLRQPPAGRRETVLRTRVMRDFLDRPVNRLAAPTLGSLVVVGCGWWPRFSRADVLQGWWSTSGDVSRRISVSLRVFVPNPSQGEAAASAIAVAVVLGTAVLVLRAIRDAAADGSDLSSSEVALRRKLSRYVITVATAAQAATAGLILWSAGGWLQFNESLPLEHLVRRDSAGRIAEFRQVGVQRLQPEWFLATIELAAGLALLVAAAGLAIHAVRQVRTLSPSHQPASATVAS